MSGGPFIITTIHIITKWYGTFNYSYGPESDTTKLPAVIAGASVAILLGIAIIILCAMRIQGGGRKPTSKKSPPADHVAMTSAMSRDSLAEKKETFHVPAQKNSYQPSESTVDIESTVDTISMSSVYR
ncbi:uncharacterized protein LOC143277370 [Babylonia areolata]|uniref:uncharacterized protein LOC143277370 n=1 Tax=Babylonia areolata TaxID=304850 RepID=UPI003FD1F272